MEASEHSGGEKVREGPGSMISDAELAPLSDVEPVEAKVEDHEPSNVVAKHLELEETLTADVIGALAGGNADERRREEGEDGMSAAGGKYPTADYAGRLMDLRGVGEFPTFDGQDAEWSEWRFRFEVGADLLDMGGAMRLALHEQRPIPMSQLRADYAQRAKLL